LRAASSRISSIDARRDLDQNRRAKETVNRPAIAVSVVLAVAGSASLSACRPSRARSSGTNVDTLFAEWNRSDSPGCAVGISRNGAILYEHGYGMANLELGAPITTDTVFAIASISKPFTAMSVLLAAEHGQLSLDDEVQKYIPEWVDRDDHITIRHLLTHTSGLRDAFTLLGWVEPGESAGDQNEAIARMLARQRGLNFLPGTDYQYNNGGYNLLGGIIKRATGQSLRAFAAANIFKPLGMTHSSFRDDPTMLIPNRARGYTRHVDGWHLVMDTQGAGIVGNAGMYSSVGDLLLWAENFETPRVGTPETLAAMQKPAALKDGKSSSYGFGLATGQYRGAPTVEHSGGDRGIATKVVRFPNQRFAVAVLCNEDSIVMGGMAQVNPDVVTNGIADIYLAEELAPADATARAAPSPTPIKLSDAELSEKTGLYGVVGRDLPVLMTVNHGGLLLRSYYQDDSDFEVTPIGANRFMFQNSVPFQFIPARAGRPKEWHVGDGTNQRVLQLITLTPSAPEVRSYAGHYRSEEIGVTFTLEARDTTLVLKSSGRPDVEIAPFSKDVFVGDVVGIVKFSRSNRGAMTGFTVNRELARGVRFERVK
jgi:CubicO group peptidase (beta-lactamase class C family)